MRDIPLLSRTDSSFRAVGEGGATVPVTVSLANPGTGAPERVVVKLVEDSGNIILRRPITAQEMKLQPGATRTLITRMAAPAPVPDCLSN